MLKLKIAEPHFDQFLRCLVTNSRRETNYYNAFVYGDEGKPNYSSKQYTKILSYFMKYIREDSLFIYTQDTDNINPDDLMEKWAITTENILQNKNIFQILPQYNKISDINFSIITQSNNIIDLHMNLVPKSLEFQVANVNMIENNLSIPNSIQNEDHRFLSEVLSRTNIEKRSLIESSVDLLVNESWLRKIYEQLENYTL